jgi:hypothetical protein
MTESNEIRHWLGLRSDVELELARELTLERREVGLGFTAGGSVWDELAAHPSWRDLPLGAPLELSVWQEQEGVFRVSRRAPGQVNVVRGAARQVDRQTFHLDARSEAVVLRASLDSGDDIVLCLERTACRFFRIASPLDVPGIEKFTDGVECEAWLSAEYRDFANSPGLADRVAAVGLLLRLFQPSTADARRRLLQETLASGSKVVREVRRWATELSPAICGRCAETLEANAEMLEDALVEVDAAFERGADAARALATYIALERDRLECIAAVLALRGDVSEQRSALDRLDEQAGLRLSQLGSAGIQDPLLERSAEVEPFAWWAAIAVP